MDFVFLNAFTSLKPIKSHASFYKQCFKNSQLLNLFILNTESWLAEAMC